MFDEFWALKWDKDNLAEWIETITIKGHYDAGKVRVALDVEETEWGGVSLEKTVFNGIANSGLQLIGWNTPIRLARENTKQKRWGKTEHFRDRGQWHGMTSSRNVIPYLASNLTDQWVRVVTCNSSEYQ